MSAPLSPTGRVVVVGASLAGARAAEALRRHGHEGPITVVGAESHPPYDRPPLSKRVLTGAVGVEDIGLHLDPDLGVDWLLGQPAASLDVDRRRVGLADGSDLAFDGLVIATGAQPRTLPGLAGLEGVHLLRTVDDALGIRADLDRQPRVAVIGAGFIGLEVASSCRQRDLEVTVIEFLPVPLARAIGEQLGRVCADLHRSHGVDLRLGTAVERLVGTERVEGVVLAGGDLVAADVVVIGVGVAPATAWLDGSGVDVADGVVCDEALRVHAGGRPRPDLVAAGDVARWLHRGYGERIRVEHWTNAAEQGDAAALTLVRGEDAPAFCPVPYFWSDQYSTKLQFVGEMRPTDDVEVVEGLVDSGRFVAAYGRQGRLVGALGFSRPARVMAYQRLLAEGAPFPPS